MAPSPLLHKLLPSLSLNNFSSPSLIIIFPNGQGFPQSQRSLPLWSVSFDNSESPDWSHLLLPIPILSIPFPSGSHCHIPHMLSLLSSSSWLYWKISRPRDLGLAPSATQTQIIYARQPSACLPFSGYQFCKWKNSKHLAYSWNCSKISLRGLSLCI